MAKARSTLDTKELDLNVLEAARERIAHSLDITDQVVVGFSGGKDSTVCLQLTLEELVRRGDPKPLTVFFFDEEAIAPTTHEYIERVAAMAGLDFRWYCVPILHRNGCSRTQTHWLTWNKADKDLWVRPMPEQAITEDDIPGFKAGMIGDISPLLIDPAKGQCCYIMGIRADESMRRRRAVCRKLADNYIFHDPDHAHIVRSYPIYDWRTPDVWRAPHILGWDYNHTYDLMEKLGISRHDQRVAPPYGEEPMQSLHMWQPMYPKTWDKMLARVPGARTAARYSKTVLYGFGKKQPARGCTWKDMVKRYLARWPAEVAAKVAARVKDDIRFHTGQTSDPIPEDTPHPLSGVSWKFLATIAGRGDFKGRRDPRQMIAPIDEREVHEQREQQGRIGDALRGW